MNANDVNAVLDNICDKLGTTADLIIPEMAGYSIAKWSLWLVVSVIFLIVMTVAICKMIRMHRISNEKKTLSKSAIDDFINKKENFTLWDFQWVYYREEDYAMYLFIACLFGFTGMLLLCLSIEKIIGWNMAPHAMMLKFILSQLGG